MNAKGQPITRRVDLIKNLAKITRLKADNVNNRTKDFAFKNINRRDFKAMRGKECAILAFRQHITGMKQFGFFLHARSMFFKSFARFLVNHRPDIDIKEFRITDPKFLHRTNQHMTKFVGNVFLHEQNAQSRTPLPRRLEA